MTRSPRFRPTAGTPTTITTLSQGFPGVGVPVGVGIDDVAGFDAGNSSGLASGKRPRSTRKRGHC